jgi:uncharacterized surface protein with fasciclin (FAS1) repeats
MKKINIPVKNLLPLVLIMSILSLSCNKDVPEPVGKVFPPSSGEKSIAAILSENSNYSILKNALTRAGLMSTLWDDSKSFTLFAPDNQAFTYSGLNNDIINMLPLEQLVPVLLYHVVPQKVTASKIPSTFPNLQYPSLLNPAPSVSSLLRLTAFPSAINGAWINNIPIKETDKVATNGVIHTTALVVMPPTRFLWDRISSDTGLTYMKAAIQRADSGVASSSLSNLEGLLKNIGANFTIFAPTNAAFKALLTGAIYQALVLQGMPAVTAYPTAQYLASTPEVFSNPALYGALSAQTVKGILVYHIMTNRAFTNSFPIDGGVYKTVLNTVVSNHPGIELMAEFGSTFVSDAVVGGYANNTYSNILINNTPEPNGTSDQHYLNGVLHKIDQVLMPQ